MKITPEEERGLIAAIVPIADLRCDGFGAVRCDSAPTHRLVYYEAPDELFCEEHGNLWVNELLPTRLRQVNS